MPALDKELMPSPLLTYARQLRAIHTLIGQDKGDTPDAEALAEQMDKSWYALAEQEQHRMRGLAEDLHALRKGGPKRVEMSPDQLAQWQKAARDAYARFEVGDVDAALSFFRRPIPSKLPRHIIPFLQARSWEKLGDLETALVFMKEAERHDSEQMVSVLILLQRLGKTEEAVAYAERIISLPGVAPDELYLAACALLLPTRTLNDREATPLLRRVIEVLGRAQAAYVALRTEHRDSPNLDAWIAFALGLCYERTGDVDAALRTYSEALKRNPRESELLVARGLMLYDQNRAEALQDFLRATRLGARSIWPWYILARHALVEGANGDALQLAIQASERSGPMQALAEVYETIAIAQARLGQPQDWILENFATATRLDPANLRIRRNYEIALARKSQDQARLDWRRDLMANSVDPSTVRQSRRQQGTSRLTIIGEQREARISEHLVTV